MTCEWNIPEVNVIKTVVSWEQMSNFNSSTIIDIDWLYKEVLSRVCSLEFYISFVDQLTLWNEYNFTVAGEMCLRENKIVYDKWWNRHFSESLCTYWNVCWPGVTVLTSGVRIKHNCEKAWRSWKKLHPVWNFLKGVEVIEILTLGGTGICGICCCCIVQDSTCKEIFHRQ